MKTDTEHCGVATSVVSHCFLCSPAKNVSLATLLLSAGVFQFRGAASLKVTVLSSLQVVSRLAKKSLHFVKPKAIHNSPPFIHILSYISPVHTRLFCFCKIYFNIIQSSTPLSAKWSVSFTFPTSTLFAFLFSAMRATCPPISYPLT